MHAPWWGGVGGEVVLFSSLPAWCLGLRVTPKAATFQWRRKHPPFPGPFDPGGQKTPEPYLFPQAADAVGEILLSLSYLPTAERLTVVVVKAKNLIWTGDKTTAGESPCPQLPHVAGGWGLWRCEHKRAQGPGPCGFS